MNLFLLSQILVGMAIVTDFLAFQCKNRQKILLFLSISCALIATHYFLLSKNTAGILIIISLIKYLVAKYSPLTRNMILLLLIETVAFYLTFEVLSDFIMLSASVSFTFGAFQKNDKYLRLLMMAAAISIITYDILIWSPVAIVLECLYFTSNAIGYCKFYWRKNLAMPKASTTKK